MSQANTGDRNDPFNLARFLNAQAGVYDRVLAELKNAKKRSHWMWYIFPQLKGLGRSSTSQYYGIKSQEEALAYLNHPVLGLRLIECANTVLAIEGRTATEIFGYPDNLKLKSSMTLFLCVASNPVFGCLLENYFEGERDRKTLQLLDRHKKLP